MTRFKWWIIWQLLFILAASLDYVSTTYALGLGYAETNVGYSPLYALGFWTILNLMFTMLKPQWLYQLARLPFLLFAFSGFANNLLVLTLY